MHLTSFDDGGDDDNYDCRFLLIYSVVLYCRAVTSVWSCSGIPGTSHGGAVAQIGGNNFQFNLYWHMPWLQTHDILPRAVAASDAALGLQTAGWRHGSDWGEHIPTQMLPPSGSDPCHQGPWISMFFGICIGLLSTSNVVWCIGLMSSNRTVQCFLLKMDEVECEERQTEGVIFLFFLDCITVQSVEQFISGCALNKV